MLDRSDSSDLVVERDVAPAGEPEDQAPAPQRTPPSDEPPEVVEAGGQWRDETPAPVDVPDRHAGVWACLRPRLACELVVWGAGGRVAAFDPTTRGWRLLARAPFEAIDGDPIWTGQRVLVWHAGAHDDDRPVGAAYDPDMDRWEPLADPPVPLVGFAAVWTGHEVVRLGLTDSRDDDGPGPPTADAYDPETGRWRALPAPPAERFGSVAGVRTEQGAMFWGRHMGEVSVALGVDEFAVAYAPATDRWEQLPPPPLFDPAEAAAVWAGDRVLLWGRPAAHVSGPAAADPPRGASYVPARGEWEMLPLVRQELPPEDLDGLAARWVGDRMVVVGGSPRGVALAYRPALREWASLPHPGGLANAVLVWTGTELLLWGGSGPDGPTVELRSYHGPSRPWMQRRFRRGTLAVF